MDGCAQRGEGVPGARSWEDVRQRRENARQAVIAAAEVCAAAVITLALRGPHGAHALAIASQAVSALRDAAAQFGAQMRELQLDEATVEWERARAAAEALAAAGIPPPRPRPDLRVVS